MEDVRFIKEMSRIYQSMECLHNWEVAYSADDLDTCRLLKEIYPQFAGIECREMTEAYAMSKRVKNANELYYWCAEDVLDNVNMVIDEEHKYWVGKFCDICCEFEARLNYDASTITKPMLSAFFDALWAMMQRLRDATYMRRVAMSCETVFVKSTPDMCKFWAEVLENLSKSGTVAMFVIAMMSVMRERGCSNDEMFSFFNRLNINLDIYNG